MRCATCGAENRAGWHFCEACGATLASACASCGESIGVSARFCPHCGTPVATAGATPDQEAAQAPVAERRMVSVLFADLVGFTALAEDRDPESTRELLTRFFDTARSAIERHGGVVEKFIGDAVMAVWGTPIAHEDDAERAVRAGLELVDGVRGLGSDLEARAGVLTGEAAVTLGATDQGMVAGDLVNTAARLQGIADPGTVLVGEPTMRAASRSVVFESVGDHDLKGKIAPVPAWRAIRVVAARGGQQRTDALEPPFVGRDDELRLLKEQLHAMGRDRRVRLVSITGPGGIGKSRLVWELEKYVDGVTDAVYWHRGRSPSYGDGIAFWALGEMVRRRAGLSEDDDEPTTRARLTATVDDFVADAADRAIIEPALLALLGIEPSPAGGREALFPAWRLFFEAISERGTTVLVFEDLQWADSGLLDFIEHVLDWSKARPILVVTLARPELFDRRPDWGAGRRTLSAIALEPLTDDQMRNLLAGLVPGLPDDTTAAIIGRAEGMPLYAVETVRALLADGRLERDGESYRPVGDLVDVAVPESLRSLIASRLDGLESADRALLQDAAVLGQVFNPATLAAVTGRDEAELDPILRGFVRRELLELESDPRSPERGQYKFVQALIREVAYGTLALRDRRARHLALARHYEAIGDDELAGALASHYLAALEASAPGAEADAVATQARLALRGAADRAAALGAHAQAVAHLDRALPITSDAAERAELLERAASSAAQIESSDASGYAREALAARTSAGDPTAVYRATVLLGVVLVEQRELEAAVAVFQEIATVGATPELEAERLAGLSRALMRLGRNDEAVEAADRALTLAEPRNLERVIAEAMANKGPSLAHIGRRREANALLETALGIATAGGWLVTQLRIMNNLAVGLIADDPQRALSIFSETCDLARRVGNESFYLQALNSVADMALAMASGWQSALDGIDDGIPRSLGLRRARMASQAAAIRSARGEPVDDLLRDVDAIIDEVGNIDPAITASLHGARAEVALNSGDFEAARQHCIAMVAANTQTEDDPFELVLVGQVALGLRDAVLARDTAGRLMGSALQGPFAVGVRAAVDGGALALEGQSADAIARFGEGFALLGSLAYDFELARFQLHAVRLLPDATEAAGWASDARAIFERVDAAAYIAQLDAATSRIEGSGRHDAQPEGALEGSTASAG